MQRCDSLKAHFAPPDDPGLPADLNHIRILTIRERDDRNWHKHIVLEEEFDTLQDYGGMKRCSREGDSASTYT